jgi:integrase
MRRRLFADVAADWRAEKVDLRAGTLSNVDSVLQRHVLPAFASKQIGSIRTNDVKRWVAKMRAEGVGPPTISKAFQVFAQIMRVAEENEWIARVPTPRHRPRTPTAKRMRALSLAEVNELADVIDPFFRTLVVVAAVSGLRWGELVGLRVENVDLLHRRILVVEQITEVRSRIEVGPLKTSGSRRSVSIPQFLTGPLQEQIAERSNGGLVFPAEEGGPLRRSNFRGRVWLPATRKAGFDGLRFHDLRHSAVTLAIAAGANAKQIQERMGHSTVRLTLDTYAHLLDDGSDVADRLEALYQDAATTNS